LFAFTSTPRDAVGAVGYLELPDRRYLGVWREQLGFNYYLELRKEILHGNRIRWIEAVQEVDPDPGYLRISVYLTDANKEFYDIMEIAT
ncbi:hypothetical protein FS837_007713, partial [Tulasnella sp. UAMH 9824]